MNIELNRDVAVEDYEAVKLEATKECECTDDMKVGLVHGDETVCKPCAARQVLNGIASLADKL